LDTINNQKSDTKAYNKSKVYLFVLFISLSLTSLLLVQQHHHQNLELAKNNSQRLLQLISHNIIAELQDGRYQDIPTIVQTWGEQNTDISLLKISSKNGYTLASYQPDKTSEYLLSVSLDIPYSYQGLARLNLSIDITPIYDLRKKLAIQILLLFLILFALISYLTHISVSRKQQTIGLHLLNQQLSESKAKYKRLVLNLHDHFLFTVQATGEISYVTPSISRILGYEPEEVYTHYEEFLTPSSQNEKVRWHIQESLSGNQQPAFCAEVKAKNNHLPHLLEITMVPIFDEHGKVISNEGIAKDITEKQQAENALQRNLLDQEIIASILRMSLQPHPLEEILRQALIFVLQRHGLGLSPQGCIFLTDDVSNELVMKVRFGLPDSIVSSCARVAFGQCICGIAAQNNRVVFSDHIDEQHHISYDGIKPHGHYCVPIQIEGKVLGVLNMYIPQGHIRTPVEEQFVLTIADTLAGIILRKQGDDKIKQAALNQLPYLHYKLYCPFFVVVLYI